MNLQNLAYLLALLVPVTAAAAPKYSQFEIPAHFENNRGQWAPDIRYVARLGEHTVSLTASEAIVPMGHGRDVRIGLRNAHPRPVLEGLEPRTAATNYFVGSRQSWRTGIKQYSRIRYREVYAGIDLDYYLAGDRLEFDFIVRPGADPSVIRMRFSGADKLSLSETGDLVIEAAGRELRQLRPTVYQQTAEGRRPVEGSYRLTGAAEVGFHLGKYAPAGTLVIDPVLVYSSYLGGVNPEVGTVIGVDQQGKLWIAGNTSSADLPVRGGAFKDAKIGGQDIFVARFNPAVTGEASLELLTYLGGTGADEVKALHAGSFFIALAGSTTSTDFPLAGNSTRTTNAGERDIFVTLLNPLETGDNLLAFSTYLGGASTDIANAVTLDADNVYVTGYTTSDNFPLAGATYLSLRRGGYDAFVARITPSLPAENTLTYSTYFGSLSTDVGTAIAVDAGGFIYFGGYSLSDDLPLEGALFSGFQSGRGDAFLAKLDTNRGFPEGLLYSTYFGGSEFDKLYALKLDGAGGIIVAGYTDSDDFPVTANAYQTGLSGDSDVFIARFDLSLGGRQALTYSTYLGGSDTDILYGAAVDRLNRVLVTGYTLSPNFPEKGGGVQNGFGGAIDAFVALVDPASAGESSLIGSTLLGGSEIDAGYGAATDASGRGFVTGFSVSANLPVSEGAYNRSFSGIWDAFISALDF